MKPKKLKPLKALGPVHAKPLHYGAAQADGTGASIPRLRARGLFYCDVAAVMGWSERRAERVVGSLERWGDEDLESGRLRVLVRGPGSGEDPDPEPDGDPDGTIGARQFPLMYNEQAKLWDYLKTIPETHPSLMIAYYSRADGKYGKQPGTVSCVYYQDREGKTRYDVDAALAVLNDRYEVIAA